MSGHPRQRYGWWLFSVYLRLSLPCFLFVPMAMSMPFTFTITFAIAMVALWFPVLGFSSLHSIAGLPRCNRFGRAMAAPLDTVVANVSFSPCDTIAVVVFGVASPGHPRSVGAPSTCLFPSPASTV